MDGPSRCTPGTGPAPAHWTDSAACRAEEDGAIFFPEDFPRAEVPLVAMQARAVCRRCPVIEECLAVALARPEPAGVWGGLDKDERAALRRRQQKRLRKAARRQGGGDGAAPTVGAG